MLSTQQAKTLRRKSDEARADYKHTAGPQFAKWAHGCVTFWKGKASGWTGAELPDPTRYRPGVIAVASNGSIHQVEGGDDNSGAERWTLIAHAEPDTPVVFRTFKDGGHVIALFPSLPGDRDPNTCESYMRVGQHGSASVALADVTRPATPDEAAPLRAELESIGYRLREVKRPAPAHRAARIAALSRDQIAA